MIDLFKKRKPSGRGALVKGWVSSQLDLDESDPAFLLSYCIHMS